MKSTPSIQPQHADEPAGRTDLGRRMAARRAALGLSREELGRKCGADGNYITYLEEHSASPAIGTLVRIADVLGVTVDDLTGASAGRVRGRSTARRDTALVSLEEDECRTLLGTHGVGRIAVFNPEGPAVLPVNYLIAGPDIAFRTAAEALAARAAGTEVAFEIDNIDDVTAGGWSVLAVGELESVTDPEEIQHLTATARSEPWAGGPRTHWMKLTPVRLTGRRVAHES
ncbi:MULTISPECIES: pyridoxamine 5'-phosphate oxidase family protein [unclassified Streptomyces]|uniref:helix-turn-helix domain-containing protein n=1 Tax=unclassified Streptomyces TaxID=2593676 RepID=UPI002255B3FA|nr:MULTISPECIES: pyridoxamine 5'-phosphate oxidase family protein [unclassified Streptomyces]MCX5010332.1 pyridoxamine 5'-phosphate oxidase family protein [Streptomyces sp. NBC_00555]MCX5610757.1 pyridoxamine 5'-phosphate oxidase family protein [Streptomyces sp. NBC_00047]